MSSGNSNYREDPGIEQQETENLIPALEQESQINKSVKFVEIDTLDEHNLQNIRQANINDFDIQNDSNNQSFQRIGIIKNVKDIPLKIGISTTNIKDLTQYPDQESSENSFQTVDTEQGKEENQLVQLFSNDKEQKKLDNYQIFTLAFIVFCCHYGYAIEVVFISPYFLQLNPPDLLDSIIWIFPTIIGAFAFPFAKFFMTNDQTSQKLRKLTMIIFGMTSLIGLLIIGECQTISKLVSQSSILKKQQAVVYLSIIGFIIQDIGQETMQELVGVYIHDLVQLNSRRRAQHILIFADSFGQFIAYFISSFLAFHVDVLILDKKESFNENFTIAYNIGACLSIISIILAYNFLHSDQQNLNIKGNYIDIVQKENVTIDNFLPGLKDFKKLSPQLTLLLLSGFMINISLLTVSAYATLWTGISVLESSPNAHSKQIKNDLFDMGVSWGALTLTIASVFYYFASIFIKLTKRQSSLKIFYIVIEMTANFSFLMTYSSDDFYTLLFSLPLWGCSLSAYNSIPNIIAEQVTYSEFQIQLFHSLTYVSNLFSQFFIYFVVPILFFLFDVQDDISFSLLIASFCGGTGTLLLILI